MALNEELEGVAARAAELAEPGEELAGVLATEPGGGARVYLCAYRNGAGTRWLGFDEEGSPIGDRSLVRDAASIAALCELAAETAGGGDLEALRNDLAALRLRENPPGVERANPMVFARLRADYGGIGPPRSAGGSISYKRQARPVLSQAQLSD